jgi:hypothetical protein
MRFCSLAQRLALGAGTEAGGFVTRVSALRPAVKPVCAGLIRSLNGPLRRCFLCDHQRVRMIPDHGDLNVDELLDIFEELFFRLIAEGYGIPAHARAGGATDAVHIGFWHLGEVKIDHVGELDDIDAARDDIRCHQHAGLPLFEARKRKLARVLALVGMDDVAGDLRLRQPFCDFICAVLRAGKHQRGNHAFTLEQVDQQIDLVCLVHEIDRLLDVFHGGGDGCNHNLHGIAQNRFGQLFNLRGHGG